MSAGAWQAGSVGVQAGLGLGSIIGGFFSARAQKKIGAAQARVARLQASAQASNLRAQAEQIAHSVGQQEYALYKQQQARAATVEAQKAALSGAMQEGSIVERQVMQAGVDARNRDYLVEEGKSRQASLNFQAEKTLQAGENSAYMLEAGASANASSALASGFATGFQSFAGAASGVATGVKDYGWFTSGSGTGN